MTHRLRSVPVTVSVYKAVLYLLLGFVDTRTILRGGGEKTTTGAGAGAGGPSLPAGGGGGGRRQRQHRSDVELFLHRMGSEQVPFRVDKAMIPAWSCSVLSTLLELLQTASPVVVRRLGIKHLRALVCGDAKPNGHNRNVLRKEHQWQGALVGIAACERRMQEVSVHRNLVNPLSEDRYQDPGGGGGGAISYTHKQTSRRAG